MSYYRNYANDIRREGPFYQDPKTGEWKKIDYIKDVDIRIGEPQDPDYCRPRTGIDVHVSGLDNYDQVKDLIGYVYSLLEKK